MICYNCKKQLEDESKYCYQCGTFFGEKQRNYSRQNKEINMYGIGLCSQGKSTTFPKKSEIILKVVFMSFGVLLVIGIIISAILLAVSGI